jgi:hypothetical protein
MSVAWGYVGSALHGLHQPPCHNAHEAARPSRLLEEMGLLRKNAGTGGRLASESYLLFVFALALAARVSVVFFPDAAYIGPGLLYDQLGLRIAVGLGMGPTAALPPLYPEFLGLLYRVYGYSYLAVALPQSLLGALTAVLTGLAVRYAGLGRKYALLAGILVALFPQALAQTRHLSPQVMVGFLFLAGSVMWVRRKRTPAWIDVVIAGIAFGLCILARTGMIVPVLCVILARGMHRERLRLRARSLVLLALALSIPVPWIVRNSQLHEELVLVDSTWALRLRAATIPGSHEIEYRVPGRTTEQPDHMEVLENRLALADVIGFGLNNSATVVGVWLRRAQDEIGFSGWNDAATRDRFPYEGSAYRSAQAIMFGALLTLFLSWLVLLRGRGDPERVCMAAVVGFFLLAAVGGGPGDSRLYALPFLAVLAMRGAWGLLVLTRIQPFAAETERSSSNVHDPAPPLPIGVEHPSKLRVVIWCVLVTVMWIHGLVRM